MKKWFLSLAMMALLSAPSMAYVQGGHLIDSNRGAQENGARHYPMSRWLDPGTPAGGQNGGANPNPIGQPIGSDATQPIPEPGTMVLASLGLLALGVSRARRRGH